MDSAWKSLAQVNEWIRFADAKAAATLAASGVLGGLLVKQVPSAGDFAERPGFSILLALAILCDGSAALITTRTLAPRLRTGEPRSLIYFDHIAKRYQRDAAEFSENFVRIASDEQRFAIQLSDQIWANSQVARRKFRNASIAIYMLGGAMVASGCAVVLDRLSG